MPTLARLWLEPGFEPLCPGVWEAQYIPRPPHLLWAQSFPCDRVRLGKQSPGISAGKCAPGAFTSSGCNCLLTAEHSGFSVSARKRAPSPVIITQYLGWHHPGLYGLRELRGEADSWGKGASFNIKLIMSLIILPSASRRGGEAQGIVAAGLLANLCFAASGPAEDGVGAGSGIQGN